MIESLTYLFLGLGAAMFAYRAMISKHLLPATLYLACVSALVTVTLYMLGAFEVAVIELSVGAGLVTVLLVYALSVVGEDTFDPISIIPKPLAFMVVAGVALLMGWMAYPLVIHPVPDGETLLAEVLWQQRVLDVWVQVGLIFSGVIGVLGLLSEKSETQKVSKQNKLALETKQEVPA